MPNATRKYAVPEAIRQLRPRNVACFVKAIPATSQKNGIAVHYYVYERTMIEDGRRPGVKKAVSGPCLGKIEGGAFWPNNYYRQKYSDTKTVRETEETTSKQATPDSQAANLSPGETKVFKEKAANLHVDMKDLDIQLKDYGEYAALLSSTKSVLIRLNNHFSASDAQLIYALSIIYFLEDYMPASCVNDIFDQSILGNRWPSLVISENMVGEFLWQLGRHPALCDEYSQSLIDESSGMTAIDGHVILTCSRQNDLADYGNKYQKPGNTLMNVLQAYDVENKVPLTSRAYEGGVPDKLTVKDLFSACTFPAQTTLLVDMDFYSEDNLGLFREGGKHFIIPVPDSAAISKAMKISCTFTGSFSYVRNNEYGTPHEVRILYRETTVEEMEKLCQNLPDREAERKNEDEKCKDGQEPKKHDARKITPSKYGLDRLIMYRDEEMHDKLVAEYSAQIGSDAEHTVEELQELGPEFGVIILRLNLAKEECSAEDGYVGYKKRWTTETHYNFAQNTIRFAGLKTDDYSTMQGLSFMMVPVGQIKAAYTKKLRSSESEYVSHLSIQESIVKASRIKLSQHMDRKWYVSGAPNQVSELMDAMGVDIASDMCRLAEGTYGCEDS